MSGFHATRSKSRAFVRNVSHLTGTARAKKRSPEDRGRRKPSPIAWAIFASRVSAFYLSASALIRVVVLRACAHARACFARFSFGPHYRQTYGGLSDKRQVSFRSALDLRAVHEVCYKENGSHESDQLTLTIFSFVSALIVSAIGVFPFAPPNPGPICASISLRGFVSRSIGDYIRG
jgi:hypothetical protein